MPRLAAVITASFIAALLSMRTETDSRPLTVLVLLWGVVAGGLAVRAGWRRWRAPRQFGRDATKKQG